MADAFAWVYLVGGLAAFLFGVTTFDVRYGRGVTGETAWADSFLFALLWPVVVVFFVVLLGAVLILEILRKEAKT